ETARQDKLSQLRQEYEDVKIRGKNIGPGRYPNEFSNQQLDIEHASDRFVSEYPPGNGLYEYYAITPLFRSMKASIEQAAGKAKNKRVNGAGEYCSGNDIKFENCLSGGELDFWNITSTYRSPSKSREVGSYAVSPHLINLAADFDWEATNGDVWTPYSLLYPSKPNITHEKALKILIKEEINPPNLKDETNTSKPHYHAEWIVVE
ncbi:MAG: hypothetical protein ABEH43_00650, partial [Flavobacteriales bacterium]